jgi:hypothetical protein
MTIIHLDNDATAIRMGSIAFPSYTGRKYKLQVLDGTVDISSYWIGGTRDYYQIIRLEDMVAVPVPENGLAKYTMRQGYAVVEHTIFMGQDAGITIFLHPENATAHLPPVASITRNEKIVLVATRSLKSSYAGQSNYRFSEANRMTGITASEYEAAKTSLVAAGFLNKAGAITPKGRNAAGTQDLYQLRSADAN